MKSAAAPIKSVDVNFVVISNERFEIQLKYNEQIINYLKSIKSKSYDTNTRNWNFLLTDYSTIVSGLMKFGFVNIIGIPNCIFKAFRNQCYGNPTPNPINLVTTEQFEKVDPKIRAALFPFQAEGVKHMIGKNGRCLLADDMGLGKTIQALGAASYYRQEWPLLIICPSSVKLAWRDQTLKWVTGPLNITVVNSSRDLNEESVTTCDTNTVVLISYDLVSKLVPKLTKKNFQVIIIDESHFIKDYKSVRAKSCVPLLKKARRVFLLSGTPALSRPSEMFSQVDCVNPSIFGGYFTEFGNRYCAPKKTKWGISYLGSTNISELQVLLTEHIMLRRIKNDVLNQLPEKHREVIILAPQFLAKASLKRDSDISAFQKMKGMERHAELLRFFHETGRAKIDAIKNYIDDLVETQKKALFFAHHSEVLNAVEEQLVKKGVGYIRIDGSVSATQKRDRAEKFQFDDSVQIAVLSIMAAGTGINLTAASLVVFGELFWNPGVLLQAENRCHRIGQRDLVTVHYLVAEKTADDFIWPLVQRKLEVLSKVGINKETFKGSSTTRLEESFSEKDVNKPKMTIMDYFEKDFIDEAEVTDVVVVDKVEEDLDWMDDVDWTEEEVSKVDQPSVAVTTTVAVEEDFDFDDLDDWSP